MQNLPCKCSKIIKDGSAMFLIGCCGNVPLFNAVWSDFENPTS